MSAKPFFLVLGIILAFLAESFFSWNIGGIKVPLAFSIIFLLFLRLTPGKRMLLALVFGLGADSLSILPFGTHLISFLAISFFIDFLHAAFSNIKAPLAQNVALGAVLLLFYGLSISVSAFLNSAGNSILHWPPRSVVFLMLGMVSWSVMIPAILGSTSILFRKMFFGIRSQ